MAEPLWTLREIVAATGGTSEAIAALRKGDVLLIAGKGHETGQTIGTTIIPFSDHDAVAAARGRQADGRRRRASK